jgi:hypothetical protein
MIYPCQSNQDCEDRLAVRDGRKASGQSVVEQIKLALQ